MFGRAVHTAKIRNPAFGGSFRKQEFVGKPGRRGRCLGENAGRDRNSGLRSHRRRSCRTDFRSSGPVRRRSANSNRRSIWRRVFGGIPVAGGSGKRQRLPANDAPGSAPGRRIVALQFGKSFGKSLEKKTPDAAAVSGLWRFSHPPFAQGESSLRYPIGPKAVGIRGRIISESGFGLRCTGFPNG